MQFKRLADDAVGTIVQVSVLLKSLDAGTEVPVPIAAALAAGKLERTGPDNLALKADDAVVASAGLGDHVAVFDGVVSLLSERAFVRGFDPA